jgi:hypothetical protein
MVAGITTFAKPVEHSVEDRLAAGSGLGEQWQDVAEQRKLIYGSLLRESSSPLDERRECRFMFAPPIVGPPKPHDASFCKYFAAVWRVFGHFVH